MATPSILIHPVISGSGQNVLKSADVTHQKLLFKGHVTNSNEKNH
jgi:hypothetical protein